MTGHDSSYRANDLSYAKTESMYKQVLEFAPNDPGTLCNYGCFLEDVRCDYDGAEALFKQVNV